MGAIYALIHPDTNEPYYVGLARYPEEREFQHLVTMPRQSTRALLDQGKQPTFKILAEYDNMYLDEAEKAWISRMVDRGLKLDNAVNYTPVRFLSDDNDYEIYVVIDDKKVVTTLKPPYQATQAELDYISGFLEKSKEMKPEYFDVLMQIYKREINPRSASRMACNPLRLAGYLVAIKQERTGRFLTWRPTDKGIEYCRERLMNEQ